MQFLEVEKLDRWELFFDILLELRSLLKGIVL
jgi:hypothetical protein